MSYTLKYTGSKVDKAIGLALGFDVDDDGVVDKAKDADQLGGQSPDYYAVKAEYVESTLATSGWNSNTYSLEADYPSETYDIFVYPSSDCAFEEYQAFSSALMVSDKDNNVLTALGTVPEIDIPVILKVVKK